MNRFYLIIFLPWAILADYIIYKDVTTKIKDPFNLRDPFKRVVFKRKSALKKEHPLFGEGSVFSNLPSIENVPISKIKIVGVLLGKERRAMARIGGSTETFILREGMKLGESGQNELKAILPGGIVVVEKIKDVYDKDEYIETLIPVSPE